MIKYPSCCLFILLSLSCSSNIRNEQSARNPDASTHSSASPSPALSQAPGSQASQTDSDVVVEVRKIVGRTLDLDYNEVGANTPLSELRKPADELDFVEIVMSVEEAFNIAIRDDELGGGDIEAVIRSTPQQIADLVMSRRKTK